MPERPCTHNELIARVVALESNLAALRQVLDERDERYKQRATSQDEAVKTALQSSEKAVSKAETATEKRLEGLNELRAMTQDQSATFARKDEVRLLMQAFEIKLGTLDDQLKVQSGKGIGMKDAWGYFIAAVMAVIAGAIYFHQ